MEKLRYKNFPQSLKDRVDQIRKEQNKLNTDYNERTLLGLFSWILTSEGFSYWRNIWDTNNFSDFQDKVELKDKAKITTLKKNVLHISEVEDMYGSRYSIGDKIRICEKTTPGFNKIYEIKGFRWNKEQTRICAITKTHTNGIRLDWIEHYLEPKKEPEFVLPEKWFVERTNDNYSIINKYFENLFPDKMAPYSKNGYISLTDEKSRWMSHSKSFYFKQYNFIEITFEQFFRYVLFNGFKIGDKIWGGEKIITDLQYINGQSVVFYKYAHNGHTSPGCRMLLKNVQL